MTEIPAGYEENEVLAQLEAEFGGPLMLRLNSTFASTLDTLELHDSNDTIEIFVNDEAIDLTERQAVMLVNQLNGWIEKQKAKA